MAACDGPCETFSIPRGAAIWFKIDQGGFYPDNGGHWASDVVVKTGAWSGVKIPPNLKPGPYLIRHEGIALHAAFDVGGAQL
jgi:cellulase